MTITFKYLSFHNLYDDIYDINRKIYKRGGEEYF